MVVENASPTDRLSGVSPEDTLSVLAARLDLDDDGSAEMRHLLAEGLDWDAVGKSARRFCVEPLLYRHLSRPAYSPYVPEEMLRALEGAYRRQATRGLYTQGHLTRMLEAMNRASVSVCLLKGAFLAPCVYGDLALRPMSDIDILCRKSDAGTARDVMLDLGYEPEGKIAISPNPSHLSAASKRPIHLPPFVKNGAVRVELHTDIFKGIPQRADLVEALWKTAAIRDLHGVDVYCMSHEHQLMHVAHHLCRHVETGNVPLYWFCDIREFVKRYGAKIDWDRFCELADDLGVGDRIAGLFDFLSRHWETDFSTYFSAYAAPGGDRAAGGWDLASTLFRDRDLQRNYLSFRIRLLRDVKREHGWGGGFAYLLRHFVPSRSHIRCRYEPKNRLDTFRCYVVHFCRQLSHVGMSLFLVLSSALFRHKRRRTIR